MARRDRGSATGSTLAELARVVGVEREFVDALGIRRIASPETLRLVLDAMGIDAATPAKVRAALRDARAIASSEARAVARDTRVRTSATRCFLPRGRFAGLYANLYTVRGARDSGVGDFGTLAELVDFAAARDLDYVAVNPLHALRNTRGDSSPYYPVSRRFRNPLYLDLDAIPEATVSGAFSKQAAVQKLARARVIDYGATWGIRLGELERLHRMFLASADKGRRGAFDVFAAFVAGGGRDLERFAIYQALDEHLAVAHGFGFSNWPQRYRDPGNPAVATFARERRDRVDFHLWLQFESDRQWHALGRRARDSGLRIGLYTDLAVAPAPDSADVWMDPEASVRGFSLGAPPDGYSREGQLWGLPPRNPFHTRRDGGESFGRLVRATFEGAGAARIDHAIGLVRQYWIPNGARGTEGVMVRMPSRLLFETIARESRRARCIVVAEDLGTVPPELPVAMRRHRMLASRVLLFSRGSDGAFEPPRDYPANAAASIGTHDLVPLAGWIGARELPILRKLGLLESAAELRDARRGRRGDVVRMREMLRKEGSLRAAAHSGVKPAAIVAAAHRALARSNCALVTYALDDLALETTPVNVPTATFDRYPVWARRMKGALASIRASAREAPARRTASRARSSPRP